jgi:hypothetical protein
MWVEANKANSLAIAEMWKELYEGEGIPARIRSAAGQPRDKEIAVYSILVPQDKLHLLSEVKKKL